ncbi:MAG: hypothetical protein N2C14_01305 [Planctomycetales bacterium]
MHSRPTLRELESRCQKPRHRTTGTWPARFYARPVAARITWLILPWGISAHAVTAAALLAGFAASAAFAWGSVAGWLLGAGLLQLWYLLDHVDGQVARYRGTDSLDGVSLDYLMHHLINLAIPLGVGFGLFASQLEPLWLLAGVAWAMGLLTIGLCDDVRYKGFMKRLKIAETPLRVRLGHAARGPSRTVVRNPLRLAARIARKCAESHVWMNLLTVVAALQWLTGDAGLALGSLCVGTSALLTPSLAAALVIRSLASGQAEREFDQWYETPPADEQAEQTGQAA